LNSINIENNYEFQLDNLHSYMQTPLPKIDELIISLCILIQAKKEYDKIKDIEILDLIVNGPSNIVGNRDFDNFGKKEEFYSKNLLLLKDFFKHGKLRLRYINNNIIYQGYK
jgi:hypothetical protein